MAPAFSRHKGTPVGQCLNDIKIGINAGQGVFKRAAGKHSAENCSDEAKVSYNRMRLDRQKWEKVTDTPLKEYMAKNEEKDGSRPETPTKNVGDVHLLGQGLQEVSANVDVKSNQLGAYFAQFAANAIPQDRAWFVTYGNEFFFHVSKAWCERCKFYGEDDAQYLEGLKLREVFQKVRSDQTAIMDGVNANEAPTAIKQDNSTYYDAKLPRLGRDHCNTESTLEQMLSVEVDPTSEDCTTAEASGGALGPHGIQLNSNAMADLDAAKVFTIENTLGDGRRYEVDFRFCRLLVVNNEEGDDKPRKALLHLAEIVGEPRLMNTNDRDVAFDIAQPVRVAA